MTKMEIFYRQIKHKFICSVVLFFILNTLLSCKEVNNNAPLSNEVLNKLNEGGTVEFTFRKYADSINNLKTTNDNLPKFISNYPENLRNLENHIINESHKKDDIYNSILNLVQKSELRTLRDILNQKVNINENEKMVLDLSNYLLSNGG